MCRELAESRCRTSGKSRACVEEQVNECWSRLIMPPNWKPNYPKLYLIHINFDSIKDPEVQKRINKISTDFQLKKEDADLLIETAGKLLEENSQYHEFLQDIRQDNLTEQREK